MEHVAVLPKMSRARAEREAARRPSVDKRMTAEAAVKEADAQMKPIFDRWREQGKI